MIAFDAANRLVAAGAAGPGCDAVSRGLCRSVSGGYGLSRRGIFLIDFVAVFEDRDRVSPSVAIAVAVIPLPVSPGLLSLQALAIRLGVRPGYAMNLIHANDMAGRVADVDIELLWVRRYGTGVAVGRKLAALLSRRWCGKQRHIEYCRNGTDE
jgi:hypothetical protein